MRSVILSGCLFCAGAIAQDPSSGKGPQGTVSTIDGRSFTGTLSVDANGKVTVGAAGQSIQLALDDVATFSASDARNTPGTPKHRVWLRSGQELGATNLRGVPAADGRPSRLAAELALGVTLELPLSTIRALRHGGSELRPESPSFAADRLDPPANNDLLYVHKDGKHHRFQVTVTGMRADAVDFDLRGAAHDYALEGVVAIVFGDNTGFAADEQKPPRAAIDFATGDHLEGRLLGLGEKVSLRLDEGCEVEVPSAHIVRLAIASDRLQWLSDLVPEVQQTPAFDRVWPWTADRSVAGPGFVLGGKSFARGIGMVPRTRLTYDLGGKYDVFEALIGIDDRGGPQAHAVFRVLVDGAIAFESAPHTRGGGAEAVRIELQQCQRLAIEVDYGKNYDLGDYCAFANARVLRK